MTTETLKKIWTREDIDQILMTNDDAVMRGIVRLFEMQTQDEQLSSHISNGTHLK